MEEGKIIWWTCVDFCDSIINNVDQMLNPACFLDVFSLEMNKGSHGGVRAYYRKWVEQAS